MFGASHPTAGAWTGPGSAEGVLGHCVLAVDRDVGAGDAQLLAGDESMWQTRSTAFAINPPPFMRSMTARPTWGADERRHHRGNPTWSRLRCSTGRRPGGSFTPGSGTAQVFDLEGSDRTQGASRCHPISHHTLLRVAHSRAKNTCRVSSVSIAYRGPGGEQHYRRLRALSAWGVPGTCGAKIPARGRDPRRRGELQLS